MTYPEAGNSAEESSWAEDQSPFALPEGRSAESFTDPFEITEVLPNPDVQPTEELDLGGQGIFDSRLGDYEPTVDYGSYVAPAVPDSGATGPAPVGMSETFVEAELVEQSNFAPEPTLTDLDGLEDPYGYGANDPYSAPVTPPVPTASASTYDAGWTSGRAEFDPYTPGPQSQPSTEFPSAFAGFDTPQSSTSSSAPTAPHYAQDPSGQPSQYGAPNPYASQNPAASQNPSAAQNPYGTQTSYAQQNPYAAQTPYGAQTAWAQPPTSAVQPYQQNMPYHAPKSKIAAALLAWFLGHLGLHNFYLGYQSKAVTQLTLAIIGYVTTFLLIGFLILPIVYIWGFVEFVTILLGSGGYDRDANGYPLNS